VVGFITALLSVFVFGRPELWVSITAGAFFLSGILRIAYAYIFEPGVQSELSGSKNAQLGTANHDYATSPVDNILMPSLDTRRLSTSEMVGPPSVSEHTTKLLDNE
jgi:hypothetical protein